MASTIDVIVIVAYLIFVLWVGIRAARGQHLDGYLVNKRQTRILVLTVSNVATLIGAGAIIGPAAAAYSTGISYGIPVLLGVIVGAALLAIAAPRIKAFGDKYKAYTLGDYFGYRYGKKHRTIAAVLLLLLSLVWSALQFAAIAQLLKVLLGIDFEIAIIGSAIVTILYTSLAGIKSDILTDFWQFWVMAAMFILLIPAAWIKTGGLSALKALPPSHFDPLAFGGAAFLVGGVLLAGFVLLAGVHYWQRIYAADSIATARKSFWYAVPFAILFVIASVMAGLFASVLLPNIAADTSLFSLMDFLLPSGLLGLAYAGILAVAMSSVDSSLLGGSATVLKDLYMPFFHPKMHEHELLNMARYVTVLLGIISAAIAFFIPNIVQLSILAASTALVFIPSIIGGLFWKRTTPTAAIVSLLASIIVLYALVPFAPKIAFLPSFLVGTILLIIISFFTKQATHSQHPV